MLANSPSEFTVQPADRPASLDHQRESSIYNGIVFHTPAFNNCVSIPKHQQCLDASCTCKHFIGGNPSQLKPCCVAPFLFGDSKLDYMDDDECLFLWNGLINGFDIVDRDCSTSYNCENYDSILAPQAKAEISALLEQELLDHKVIISDSKPQCVHSLGAVWKSSGALRPITDCSRPEGVSIHNFMTSTFQSFTYNSVQDAVDILTPGDYMAVIDITSAYRSVNVSDCDSYFQGLSWDFGSGPIFLRDLRLCFGLRCAPNIFDRLSKLVMNISRARGALGVVNYLDDFLVIAPDYESCLKARQIVTSTIELLGFQVAWKKVTDPATVCTFLGISIDSVKFELSLPMDKVEKLRAVISAVLDRNHTSKKELERLGGLVSYCSYVVRGGRTFSRHIFYLAASYSRRSNNIPLSDAIKDDLQWWSLSVKSSTVVPA